MNFITTNFELDVYHINYYLGLPQDVDVECYKSNNTTTSHIKWTANIEERSWGIKSIIGYTTSLEINILWEINGLDLTNEQRAHLFERHHGFVNGQYFCGIITLNYDSFNVVDAFDYNGQLMINQVDIDFMDEEITIR